MTTENGKRKCSQCGSKRLESEFEFSNKGKQFKTCTICRNRYKLKKSLKIVEVPIVQATIVQIDEPIIEVPIVQINEPIIEVPIIKIENHIITENRNHQDENKMKCSMCKCVKPEAVFYNVDGRQLKTCDKCRNRVRPEKKSSEPKELVEGKSKCTGCKSMRSASEYKNNKGKTFKNCAICRERRGKISMDKKIEEAESIKCASCKLIKLEEIYKSQFVAHNPLPIAIEDELTSTNEFNYDNIEVEYFNLANDRMPFYNQVESKLSKVNYYEMMRKYVNVLDNKSKQTAIKCQSCESAINEAIKNRPIKFKCIKNLSTEIIADYKKRVDGMILIEPLPEPIKDAPYDNFEDEYEQITKTKLIYYNQISTKISASEYYNLLKCYTDFKYDCGDF